MFLDRKAAHNEKVKEGIKRKDVPHFHVCYYAAVVVSSLSL